MGHNDNAQQLFQSALRLACSVIPKKQKMNCSVGYKKAQMQVKNVLGANTSNVYTRSVAFLSWATEDTRMGQIGASYHWKRAVEVTYSFRFGLR